jgi:ubiquinone/menaquinone biosynthesis C-methylase UbiE
MNTNIYVHSVYENIAQHFSDTRYSQWKCVRDFLDNLPPSSFVADIGCGNGKNMLYRDDLVYVGCDITDNLVTIAKNKTRSDILRASGLELSYRDNVFDASMSIAVIHHMATHSDRKKFISELVRCTNKGGYIMFTVWMMDQPRKAKWIDNGGGDFFIPWTDKSGTTYNRYYHFFTQDELMDLIKGMECNLIKIYEECYNYVVILQKKD